MGGCRTIRIWDVQEGRELRRLDRNMHTAPITSIRWHPNGALVATTSADNTTVLWVSRAFSAAGWLTYCASSLQLPFPHLPFPARASHPRILVQTVFAFPSQPHVDTRLTHTTSGVTGRVHRRANADITRAFRVGAHVFIRPGSNKNGDGVVGQDGQNLGPQHR